MTPKALDIFVTGIIYGIILTLGIILLLIILHPQFSFSSPSSEAIPIYRGGFITAGYSRGPTDVSHKHGIAGSNPVPAIVMGPNYGVRSGLREAPPTHRPSGLHKNQPGRSPEMLPPDGAGDTPALSIYGPKRQITETSSTEVLCREWVRNDKVGKRQSRPTFIVRKAAERNGIKYGSDNWFILLAIRKQENGRKGCEFGVKGKAWGTDLDTQAAESACTVVKNRERWVEAGRPGTFIEFLADRYCPKDCDAVGNFNWKKNVPKLISSLKTKS